MEQWISTDKAEELTGYKADYIRQLATNGKVVSKKFGHAVMIDKESLLKYYEEHKKNTTS